MDSSTIQKDRRLTVLNSKEPDLSASGDESPDERYARGLRFNPHRRVADKTLKRQLATFTHLVEVEEAAHLPRARRRKDADRKRFHLAIEALYANVLVLLKIAPGLPLEILKSLNAIRKADSQRPEVYGGGFAQLLTLLCHPKIRLLDEIQRGFHVGERSQLSQFAPTDRLLALMDVEGFRLNQIGLDENDLSRSCLTLRDVKDRALGPTRPGQALEFRETEHIARMRRDLTRINRFLLRADFELLPLADGSYGFGDEGIPVDPTARTVVRIFNNASFMEGGRLYHGFWENMPKVQRKERLRIQGEPVATVDFGQLYPRLAYVHAGTEPPEGDLYDILGDGENRTGWKRFVNSLLLCERPLKGFPPGVHEGLPTGISLQEARQAVLKKHGAIAQLFECGAGHSFMFHESNILVNSLLSLIKQDVVALPIHDAVLVANSNATTAEEVLRHWYERTTGGSRAVISVEKGAYFQ